MQMRILVVLGLSLGVIHGEADLGCNAEASPDPTRAGRQSTIEFTNGTGSPANVYLRNDARQRLFLRTLAPGERFSQGAIEGQLFVVTDTSGRCLEVHRASAAGSHAAITAAQPTAAASGPIIQTYAGTDWTFQADGQPALKAPLGSINDLTFDAAGNLYIADALNYQAYRVDTNGILRVAAGNGFDNGSVTGVDARKSPIGPPTAVAVGPDGNLYLGTGFTLPRITPDGILNKFAGINQGTFSGDGGPAANAGIQGPYGIAFDSMGNLFFSDHFSHRVRRIDTNGIITTVAGNGQKGFGGDNGPALGASLNFPAGIRFDAAGNLYIADNFNDRIRKLDTKGTITTFAGGGTAIQDNVPATQTLLSNPVALDFDSAGNLYILEQNGARVRKVAPDGTITTVAGTGVAGFSGDGGPAIKAQFNGPLALKVDAAANIYIGDANNGRVRRFTPGGNITTVAGNGLFRFSPDGAPATLSFLKNPIRAAIGPGGRVYINDAGDARIRRVEADGTLTTIAGTGAAIFTPGQGPYPAASTSISFPDGMAFDAQGSLYFVESSQVRRVTPDGVMTTYAGGGTQSPGNEGPAASAKLNFPSGLAFDRAGNLYITETFAGSGIRKVTPDGIIHAFAGNGSPGLADGPAA